MEKLTESDIEEFKTRLEGLLSEASDPEIIARHRAALKRIADNTYGVCEVCDENIAKKLLMTYPNSAVCRLCWGKVKP
jgi:RNA polymerase-binding transcription factor DksA